MPPRLYSRHIFSEGLLDDDERLFLTDRSPYGYRSFPDNRTHLVKEGDTLYNLAHHYFRPLPRPAGLWWVLADFQPQPVHDPTLMLQPGTVLVVPSVRTVREEILGEKRRREPKL